MTDYACLFPNGSQRNGQARILYCVVCSKLLSGNCAIKFPEQQAARVLDFMPTALRQSKTLKEKKSLRATRRALKKLYRPCQRCKRLSAPGEHRCPHHEDLAARSLLRNNPRRHAQDLSERQACRNAPYCPNQTQGVYCRSCAAKRRERQKRTQHSAARGSTR